MAFFTVEDSSGAIECLAFPNVYRRDHDIIHPDHAVFVEGNLSVREEEAPKILVSTLGLLVDNDHFTESPQKVTPAPPAPQSAEPRPHEQTKVSVPPEKPYTPYNPYESMPATRPYNPYESMPAVAPPPAPRPVVGGPPKKVYLRVPDMEGEPYRKALNLVEIFCDGVSAVVFYDMSQGKYFAANLRVSATPFVLSRLKGVLGDENVVAK